MAESLPWFKRGDCIVDITNEKEPKYFKLIAEEPLPQLSYTFSNVAPKDDSDFIRMDANTTDLETDHEDFFFQYFFGVLKDGLIHMQYPLGEEFWTTDKLVPTDAKPEVACLTFKTSPYLDPSLSSEFFIVKGTSVAFKFRNTKDITMNNKLGFTGKKFKREMIVPTPEIIAKARAIRFARIA